MPTWTSACRLCVDIYFHGLEWIPCYGIVGSDIKCTFNFSRNYQNILKVAELFCICSRYECQNICMHHIWEFQLLYTSLVRDIVIIFNFGLSGGCAVACNCGFLASGSGVLSQDRKESILRDPCLGDCSVVRLIWVQIEGCPRYPMSHLHQIPFGSSTLSSSGFQIGPMSGDSVPCQSLTYIKAGCALAGWLALLYSVPKLDLEPA